MSGRWWRLLLGAVIASMLVYPALMSELPAGAVSVAPQYAGSCNIVANSGISNLTTSPYLVLYTATCSNIPAYTSGENVGVAWKFEFGGTWYESAAEYCGTSNPVSAGYAACGNNSNGGWGSSVIASAAFVYSGVSSGSANSCVFGSSLSLCASIEHIGSGYWIAYSLGSTSNTTNQGFAMAGSLTGNGGTSFGAAEFSASGSTNNACSLTALSGDDTSPTSNGTTDYTFTASFQTGASGFGVDAIAMVDDAVTSGSSTSVFGKTFYTGANGAYVRSEPLLFLQSPQSMTYVFKSGDVVNPDFWCHEGGTGGQWINWGTMSAVVAESTPNGGPYAGNTDTNAASPLTLCLDNAGWSLTNPASWVIGALKDSECVLQWLFEPSSASITAAENEFGVGTSSVCSGTATATISQLLGCMSAGIVVAPAADVATVQSAISGGSCSSYANGTTTLSIDGNAVSACTLVADTASSHFSSSASGTESDLVGIETAAVYVLCALALIFFIRRTLSGSDE